MIVSFIQFGILVHLFITVFYNKKMMGINGEDYLMHSCVFVSLISMIQNLRFLAFTEIKVYL